MYAGCTQSFGVEAPWCSTQTTEDDKYIPGEWGYCDPIHCPIHHDLHKECVTIGGPSPDQLCVFPFHHQGRFHWGCIPTPAQDEEKYFCATSVNDHAEIVEWGLCSPRCKETPSPPCGNSSSEDAKNEIIHDEPSSSTLDISNLEKGHEGTKAEEVPAVEDDEDADESPNDSGEVVKKGEILIFDLNKTDKFISNELNETDDEDSSPSPESQNSESFEPTSSGSNIPASSTLGPKTQDTIYEHSDGILIFDFEKEAPNPSTPSTPIESSTGSTSPKPTMESSLTPTPPKTNVDSSFTPNSFSSTPVESSVPNIASSTTSIESSTLPASSSTENASEIHASDDPKSINDDILFFDLESKDVSESPENVSMCLSTDTCEGRCHGGSSLTCWCDRRCVENGDCCCDYKVWCEDDESSDDASSLEKGFENQDDKSPDSDVIDDGGDEIFNDDSQDPEDATSNDTTTEDSALDDSITEDTESKDTATEDCASNETTTDGPEGVTAPVDISILERDFDYPTDNQIDDVEKVKCLNVGSCARRCGGGSVHDCWCDDICVLKGDCCCDREDICIKEKKIPVPVPFVSDDTTPAPDTTVVTTEADTTTVAETTTDVPDTTLGESNSIIFKDAPVAQATPPPILEEHDEEQEPTTTATTESNDPVSSKSDEEDSSEDTEVEEDSTPSSTDQDRVCETNDEGPVKNKTCIFPFTFGGQIHHSCVEIGECKSWCATSIDSEGNCLPDQWGYCGQDCVSTLPHPGSIT